MTQTSWSSTIALLLLVPVAVYFPLLVVLGAPVWLAVRAKRQANRAH
jgi:cytochrome c oxidase assembly factor CtaG